MDISNNKLLQDYVQRINRVFEYIDQHLDTQLSLEIISGVAHFSPYHFHRIFKFITKETLNEYITRKRIEKSALDLIHRNNSITEIAYKCGFKENSSYTKAFKKYYNLSPTEFKKEHPQKFSKIGQEYPNFQEYLSAIENLKKWIDMNATIKILEIDKMDIAYVSCIGIQNLNNSFEKLIHWATPRGLMNDKTKMIIIYFDSFKITSPDKVRMKTSILLNKTEKSEGEIGISTIEADKCIVGSFKIGIDEFEKSWTGLFLWMNEQGYKKSDKEPFEIHHNNLHEHPEKKAFVDFYIPIE